MRRHGRFHLGLSAALTAVVGATVLAGCGSGGNGASSTTSSTTEAQTSAATGAGTSAAPSTPTSGPLSKEPKITPPSGPPPTHLVIKELVPGTGATAKVGETVTVNYVGAFYHGGKVFNASWETGRPFPFSLGSDSVILGWEQGVTGMKVGGRRELIIPAALAYGHRGRAPLIPPDSPLIFVVDLLGV